MERNRELARIFDKIADFLEFKGDSMYRINAYRKVARVIKDLPMDVETLCRARKLEEVPGIGEKIAKKIAQYMETGTIQKYEELRREIPEELILLLDVSNLGPKTLRLSYERLGVRNVSDLKRVLNDGSLARLPGMGAKKVEKIAKGLEMFLKGRQRMLLGEAWHLAESFTNHLSPIAERISVAGSLRRMKETVGDVDILTTGDRRKIVEVFVSAPGVAEVLAKGDTKASVVLEERQVDLRVIKKDEWGAALQYFTGSKDHNVHLREIAKEKGLKINEYGIFMMDSGMKTGGSKEEDVYQALGLEYIPPELREERGEIESAREGRLPMLVGYEEVKGDLHVHSNWSDGTATLEELVVEAARLGYEYLAITDHSKSMKIARGLDEKRLEEQVKTVHKLNSEHRGATLLAGTEVDIHPDGSLDLDDAVLKELDWVVAAVHSRFSEDATERIVSACENPSVTSIAHPTGRLLLSREAYPLDIERVMKVAARTGTALEINAHQDRLDLNDVYSRKAKEMGVKLAIGTDAHHIGQLWMMRLGIGVARRGWLEPPDVINTYPLGEVREFVKRKRG